VVSVLVSVGRNARHQLTPNDALRARDHSVGLELPAGCGAAPQLRAGAGQGDEALEYGFSERPADARITQRNGLPSVNSDLQNLCPQAKVGSGPATLGSMDSRIVVFLVAVACAVAAGCLSPVRGSIFSLDDPPPPSVSRTTLASATPTPSCALPSTVVLVHLSAARYPTVRAHAQVAISRGWPVTLVLDRGPDASERRTQLFRHARFPTLAGYDRDEYPPAVGRSGWLADLAYVPSSENRSHGATLASLLAHYCEGTRFQYDWVTP
jgi:hypothetical protein